MGNYLFLFIWLAWYLSSHSDPLLWSRNYINLLVVCVLFEPLRYEYEIIVSVHFAMRLAKHAMKLFKKNFIYVGCVLYECFSD